jgi:SAM-dependent methyltransferase
MVNDEFLNPVCSPCSLDSYHARQSILISLRKVLPLFRGTVLDVGCGQMPYKPLFLREPSGADRYLGLDLESNQHYRNSPDLTWDGMTIPLPDSSIECAVATEVLEHCPQPGNVLSEISRVLKPGGLFFATVPFLWPLHDVPDDEYRYTPYSIRRLLAAAGFSQIEIGALGGWDASLAQMMGLWVRRRPMSETKRRVLQRLVSPVYRWLAAHDVVPKSFDESVMITGMSVVARKKAGKAEIRPDV